MKQLVKKLDLQKGYPEKCFKSSQRKKPIADVSLNLGTNDDTLDSNDSRITLVTTVEQHSLMILRRLCFKF